MYGHYREETQADVEKRVLVKNFTIYEKIDKEEKTEVWVKGTLENHMYYGFVPTIRTESSGGAKIKSTEFRRIRKNGDKINFDYKLNGGFTQKSDVSRDFLYDLVNYKSLYRNRDKK